MHRNQGQITLEFSICMLLVFLPLVVAGGVWVKLEWSRIQCANQTFRIARQNLIATNAPVSESRTCGSGLSKVTEKVELVPLEALDTKNSALGVGELIHEASALWESLSRSWHALLESGSARSSSAPTD